MMNQTQADRGLIAVLRERYNKQRLPRALALKDKVERGEPLTRFDILFLQDVVAGVNEIKPLLGRHPECHGLATHMINLCKDIAQKGLLNETSGYSVPDE